MKIVAALLLVATQLGASGCASLVFVSDPLDYVRDPAREFAKGFDYGRTNTVQGLYAGEAQIRQTKYACYQFTNALAGGRSRTLEILIPKQRSDRAIVRETSHPARPLDEALLLPFDLYQKALNEQVVVPGVYTEHAMYLYFNPHPTAAPSGITIRIPHPEAQSSGPTISIWKFAAVPGTTQLEERHFDADVQLPWKKRSRILYAMGHLGYLVSVPVDIVTFPLQYVFFVVFELGG